MEPIRVLLVDDHLLVLECLRDRLVKEPTIAVVGAVEDGQSAVDAVRRLHPDVVTMDIYMPGIDGFEATREILAQKPGVGVIMLTAGRTDAQIIQAVRAGARGYLVKDASASELIAAIHGVARGEVVIDAASTAELFRLLQQEPHPEPSWRADRLTDRERHILRLIAQGHHNREIATALNLAERTVKKNITEIFRKLHASDRAQAASQAIQRGLIAPLPDAVPEFE